MKLGKFLLTAMLFIAFGTTTKAQVKTTVTLPDWGVAGYENARYYYIPATETYYDIRKGEYVYQQEGKWVRTTTLPTQYKDYDLYDGYKVVLEDEKEPFADYDALRIKYAKDYKGEPQKTYKIKTTRSGKVKIKEK